MEGVCCVVVCDLDCVKVVVVVDVLMLIIKFDEVVCMVDELLLMFVSEVIFKFCDECNSDVVKECEWVLRL